MTLQWGMLGANILRWALMFLAMAIGLAGIARAQEAEPAEGAKPSEANAPRTASLPIAPKAISVSHEVAHPFWDKKNVWLFGTVGAARALDFASTLNMRRRGRSEILLTNDVVDNHAAFAVIEAAGAGASLGASYLFHRYGHHRLERWMSMTHIGVATGGAIRNYCLRTRHPAPAAP